MSFAGLERLGVNVDGPQRCGDEAHEWLDGDDAPMRCGDVAPYGGGLLRCGSCEGYGEGYEYHGPRSFVERSWLQQQPSRSTNAAIARPSAVSAAAPRSGGGRLGSAKTVLTPSAPSERTSSAPSAAISAPDCATRRHGR